MFNLYLFLIRIGMIKLILPVLLFIFFLSTNDLAGQNDSVATRPKVGLVLSGGGAKGFAYIGLLQVLTEVNMPIDFIGGTSMGSIMGGLYALGYNPDTIEAIIRGENWNEMISNKQDREYLAFEEKAYSERTFLKVPIKEKKIDLGSSLTGSLNIDIALNRFFSPAYKIHDFDSLAIPFVCIAADLVTGNEVPIRSGNLARAIRASMAIPGYFPAIEYEGQTLIDGGVINNYPAKEVKDMGADIIIGGDVQSNPITDASQLKDIPKIVNHIIGFRRAEMNQIGRELTDVMIHFDMDYTTMDFDKYDSIIALGKRIAYAHYNELKALSDSLNAISSYQLSRNVLPVDTIFIDEVKVKSDFNWSQKNVGKYLIELNSATTLKAIEESIRYLNGSRIVENVTYELNYEQNRTVVSVDLGDKTKGELGAGFRYDNDYKGSLLGTITFRNVFNTRAKWFSEIIFGENPRILSTFIINNGASPGLGLSFDAHRFSFARYNDHVKVNNFTFENISSAIFVPVTFRNRFMLRAGLKYIYFNYSQEYFYDSTQTKINQYHYLGEANITLNKDSRDHRYYPTKGSRLNASVQYVVPFDSLSSSFSNNFYVYCSYQQNISLNSKLVLRPGYYLGYTIHRDVDLFRYQFGLGGLNDVNYLPIHRPFAGLNFIEKFGSDMAIGRLYLQYNYYKELYATAVIDAGNIGNDWNDVSFKQTFFGYGIKFGYESFIGPIDLSILSSSLTNDVQIFLSIGHSF